MAAAAIDERIEHETQELVHQLERAALGAGRILAVQLAELILQSGAGEAEKREEGGRQRAAGIEEIIDRGGNVLLVLVQRCAQAELCPLDRGTRRSRCSSGWSHKSPGRSLVMRATELRAVEAGGMQNIKRLVADVGAGGEDSPGPFRRATPCR